MNNVRLANVEHHWRGPFGCVHAACRSAPAHFSNRADISLRLEMAQRKQQQEIDRTLKRIQEGLQAFDSIYDKLQQQVIAPSSQTSQKEKLEQDLKKEIKKLQRHRDQVKTWAARDDIKDKKPLTDARKAIENVSASTSSLFELVI